MSHGYTLAVVPVTADACHLVQQLPLPQRTAKIGSFERVDVANSRAKKAHRTGSRQLLEQH